MSFGTRLTEARKRKQLTQDGLGRGLGTDGKDASKAVVYGWEKDQHHPRADQLKLICEKLGCSSDFLLFGTEQGSALSPAVAEIAVQIDALKPIQRDWVLMNVRQVLSVAREMFVPTTPQGRPSNEESLELPEESLRFRHKQ